jgi:hypothetical protein
MRHVQYHTRITDLPYRRSVILHCSQVFVLSFLSFPSFLPSPQIPSVGPVVGRAIHLSFKTNKHSFFPFLPSPPTSLCSLSKLFSTPIVCGGLFERDPLPSPSAFFFLGVYFLCSCVVFANFFGLPRIREYRPGRFPSHAFVSPVAAPLPTISSLIFIQPARGVDSKTTEGQQTIAIK